MSDDVLPRVSVLMPAHNYERFVGEALESAMAQTYPADRFEVIVVDDGSTDRTAEVVQVISERNPGRIRLVQQRNSGQIASVARARAEADGELLALLDADDVWLPDKLHRQVEVFRRRSEVGLVFCDMSTIDAGGNVIKVSQYEPPDVDLDHLYARVLRTNIVYNSSLMVRSGVFGDPPDTIEAWDWWLALCAAERTVVAYIPEPLALYRQHGENMLLGATGSKLVRLRRRQLRFQLWALRHLSLDPLTPAELRDVWRGPEWFVMTAAQGTGSLFQSLVEIGDAERAQAETLRTQAQTADADADVLGAARLLFRALAWDPYEPDAYRLFHDAADRAEFAAAKPDPLAGARPFVVLVNAEDLLGADDLLGAYADAMAGLTAVTLAVDASRLEPDQAAAELNALVERCGLAQRDDIDLLAFIGELDDTQRWRLRDRVGAVYWREPSHLPDASTVMLAERGVPAFTPASLARMRQLAGKDAAARR